MASMVAQLPNTSTQDLIYLCDRHKVPGKAMSRQQMVDALVALFSDPEYVYRIVKELSEPLRLTLLAYAVSSEWWAAKARLLKLLQDPHDHYLTELKHLGFVTGAYTVLGEPAQATVRVWLEGLAKDTSSPKSLLQTDPSGPGALRNIFALIGMGWRRELPLTKGGGLFKKAEEEMLRRMEGTPVITGDRLKLLVLSYALDRGLLASAAYDQNGKGGLVATKSAWDWSNLTWGEIWTDLADFLFTRRAYSLWIVPHLIHALRWLPPGAWLPHDRLVAEHRSLAGADPQGLEDLLFSMAGLGLLEIGTGPGQPYVLQPSAALRALFRGEEPKMPGEESRFLVDPTYSITASKMISPDILCLLERWCTERKADTVLTYKLSQAGLRVALEENDSPADVIKFFTESTSVPLPQNVLFSLQEWTAGARRARFEQVMLLRLDDPSTAQRILGDRTLSKWVLGEVTPTDLIIDAAAVEKVRKRLGEVGVAAKPGVRRPGEANSESGLVWASDEAPEPVSAQAFRLIWIGDGDDSEQTELLP